MPSNSVNMPPATAHPHRLRIPKSIWDLCTAEAASRFPLETGGVFLGHQTATSRALVTDMIGPGPNAVHSTRGLTVDHEWQNEQIAARYAASGQTLSYLGE